MGVGRKATPTHLKVVKGNPGKRPLNAREPKPKRGVPVMPEGLSIDAAETWTRLVALLDGMGVMTLADAPALERLCECYADILACQKLIRRDGRTYTTTTNTGDTLIKANPAVAQLRAADAQFKSYLIEFGLTPAARSKVNAIDDDKKEDDPLAEFFG